METTIETFLGDFSFNCSWNFLGGETVVYHNLETCLKQVLFEHEFNLPWFFERSTQNILSIYFYLFEELQTFFVTNFIILWSCFVFCYLLIATTTFSGEMRVKAWRVGVIQEAASLLGCVLGVDMYNAKSFAIGLSSMIKYHLLCISTSFSARTQKLVETFFSAVFHPFLFISKLFQYSNIFNFLNILITSNKCIIQWFSFDVTTRYLLFQLYLF